MVIWITGMSGVGKTTISNMLAEEFTKINQALVKLDGDKIREMYDDDLGYTVSERIIQIKRVQKIAAMLEKQNLLVIVSLLYCTKDLLKWNKENFKQYFEIYLKADKKILYKRDTKKLYKNALEGKIRNVVGVDIPWQEPINSDLILNTQTYDIKESIQLILNNYKQINQ